MIGHLGLPALTALLRLPCYDCSASGTVSSAAGSASRRSSGITTPLRTDRPYVPAASRCSARPIAVEPVAQPGGDRVVDLFAHERFGRFGHVALVARGDAVVARRPERRVEKLLHALALGREQHSGPFVVHRMPC